MSKTEQYTTDGVNSRYAATVPHGLWRSDPRPR